MLPQPFNFIESSLMLVLSGDELFPGSNFHLYQALNPIQLSLCQNDLIFRLDEIHLELLNLSALYLSQPLAFLDGVSHLGEKSNYFPRNAATHLSFLIGVRLYDTGRSNECLNGAQIGSDRL